MNRREMLWSGVGIISGLQVLPGMRKAQATSVVVPPKQNGLRRGVALAGAEFGTQQPGFSNEKPGEMGRDYTYNREYSTRQLAASGLNLIRLPFRWERIQPVLGGELDAAELARLQQAVAIAKKYDVEVILDVHNFGHYCLQQGNKVVGAAPEQKIGAKVLVTKEHFADLWRRLAIAFAGDDTVWAFGLMNEPHFMSTPAWQATSQAAVDAIRATGDTRAILVSGAGWANAHRFTEINGPRAWIDDPANNMLYEAHCYFDHNHAGHYEMDFDEELANDPKLLERGPSRLAPFKNWCQANGVRGFIGEFGVPRDDQRWREVQKRFLEALEGAEMEGCAWAAGEWWGNYRLRVQTDWLARA